MVFFSVVPAWAGATQFDYNYLEIRPGIVDVDGEGDQGILGGVSHKVSGDVFLQGVYSYDSASDVDVWVEDLYVGVELIRSADNRTDINLTAGVLVEWASYCAYYCYDDNDTGLRFAAGARHDLGKGLEDSAELIYQSIWDDSDVGIAVAVIGKQSNAMSSGVHYSSIGEVSILSALIRF